jgi:ATP-dependent RNA helicase DDX43
MSEICCVVLYTENTSLMIMNVLCHSATWPEGVRRLAQSYTKDPIQVFIGTLDLAAVHTVTQKVQLVQEEDKWSLVCLLKYFHSMS